MKKLMLFIITGALAISNSMNGQKLETDPIAIIKKSEDHLRGNSSKIEMKMTIVRPTWKREMSIKAWAKGDDYSLMLITAPARDKGTAFLKRSKEIWNWQPTIDRSIKLPPSMMMQSWMGSDFTNDDLVKQFSVVEDYTHKLLETEKIGDRNCYKIEMIPKEETAVAWGKVLIWIDVKDYLQLKTEFYDEDNYLVNTMLGENIKMLGGKLLPCKLIVKPEEEEGNQTIIEYMSMKFEVDIKDNFFSVQNMKRVR